MDKEDIIVLSRLLDLLSVEVSNWNDERLPKTLLDGISESFKKNLSRRLISCLYGESELGEYDDEALDNPNNSISEVLQMYSLILKEQSDE